MKNRRLSFKVLAPLASMLVAGSTQAAEVDTSTLNEAMEVVGQTNEAAVESQQRINRLSDSSTSLMDDFNAESNNLEALLVLNAGWRRQISIQEEELETIAESISEVRNVTQEMPLLMQKMLASIEQFIELDMPFKLEERRQRVEFVKSLLDDPGVSTAERFRQILSLYQTETSYGRTHETYPTTLTIDGVQRDVDMMRVGRIALAYQTKDRQMTGAWDPEAREWIRLPEGDYRTAIDTAIRVSSGLIAPEIIELPITAPELAQ
ncbi:MAG: DUF3450 domain-containing protein [Pseudomonadota bacterium]